MTFEITRSGKNPLIVDTPVMTAAGTFGYGDSYTDMIKVTRIGAVVTNPVTYDRWSPASGRRVIHLDSGVLIHTGLPNPGLNKVLKNYRDKWLALKIPVVLHLVATSIDHVRKSAARLDTEDSVAAIELGLGDGITWEEAEQLVKAAVQKTEKPVLVRLPLQSAYEIAETVADAGAGALVISAPPRGMALDPVSGQMITGRIYGPMVKPMVLYVIQQLVKRIDIPIIGAGGIHTPQDAREYIKVGARAVQVDSVTWINPRMLEIIGRDLGGWVATRASGALSDEWYQGIGDTTMEQLRQEQDDTAPDNR